MFGCLATGGRLGCAEDGQDRENEYIQCGRFGPIRPRTGVETLGLPAQGHRFGFEFTTLDWFEPFGINGQSLCQTP